MEAHSKSGIGDGLAYMNARAMWFTYVLVVYVLHIFLLSIPVLSVGTAWTMTNVVHNLVTWVMLHIEKGSPFDSLDQGKMRLCTVWEQLDRGEQYSSAKKFYTVVPVVLFLLATFYTKYDVLHFVINASSLLLLGLVPKLPLLHKVRLFGINKY